jgi:hypothetical protein
MERGVLRSCVKHDIVLFCVQQDYEEPENGRISRYYFPGRIDELIRIITRSQLRERIGDPLKKSFSYKLSDCGFKWPYSHGIFNTVDFTITLTYYYSSC